VHAAFEEYVGSPERSVLPGRIGIVNQVDILGVSGYVIYLICRQRRPAGCHYVAYAGLMEGDEVRIAFDEYCRVLFDYGIFRLINSKQGLAFNNRRESQASLCISLFLRLQSPAAERDHASARRDYGEHDARPETIVVPRAVLPLQYQA